METLPAEIQKEIVTLLPTYEQLRHAARVCRAWHKYVDPARLREQLTAPFRMPGGLRDVTDLDLTHDGQALFRTAGVPTISDTAFAAGQCGVIAALVTVALEGQASATYCDRNSYGGSYKVPHVANELTALILAPRPGATRITVMDDYYDLQHVLQRREPRLSFLVPGAAEYLWVPLAVKFLSHGPYISVECADTFHLAYTILPLQ